MFNLFKSKHTREVEEIVMSAIDIGLFIFNNTMEEIGREYMIIAPEWELGNLRADMAAAQSYMHFSSRSSKTIRDCGEAGLVASLDTLKYILDYAHKTKWLGGGYIKRFMDTDTFIAHNPSSFPRTFFSEFTVSRLVNFPISEDQARERLKKVIQDQFEKENAMILSAMTELMTPARRWS